MANELGSFIVNIKAQIEGYQEQINTIKQELAKVGKETDIGKEIAKSLKQAETQVNHLGRTMEKRISSESQLTSLMDNLQNISKLMMSIGESFGNVTWDDLNVDDLRTKIQEAETAAKNLGNEMSANITKGLQEAVGASSELRAVFKDLKIDPEKMGTDQIAAKLKSGLVDAQDAVAKYQKELSETSKVADEAAERVANIGADIKNVNAAKDGLDNLFGVLQQIEEQKVSDSNMHDFVSTVEDALQQLDSTVSNKGRDIVANIRQLMYDMYGEIDPSKIQGSLDSINDLFSKLTGKGLASNVEGFGGRIDAIFKNLVPTDIKQTADSIT